MSSKTPRITVVLSESPQYPQERWPWMAQVAEDAGFTDVQLGEHVVYGESARRNGLPANIRQPALPFQQDPELPSCAEPMVMLGAIAAVTTTIRLQSAALLAPLRHPVLTAKQLATLDIVSGGRLVVMPGVGWHDEEYDILGVPFKERGRRLDEHLEAWHELWRNTPASFHGRHYRFDNAYLEPKPVQPGGPTVFLGAGGSMHDNFVRRVVRWGKGCVFAYFWPDEDDMAKLASAMRAAGRDIDELEMVGVPLGMEFRWSDGGLGPAPVEPYYEEMERMIARGVDNVLFKPSVHLDDPDEWPELAHDVIRHWRACTVRQPAA